MSVLVAKNSPEFRRPPTVQRNNKGGLAKYLGAVTANGRSNNINDWNVRTLTVSPPPLKKSPLVLLPRSIVKLEKKLSKPMPGLPVSSDALSTLPSCKLSSLRLASDASLDVENSSSPHSTSPNSLEDEPITIGFKDNIIVKHVNENNNLTNNTVKCTGTFLNLRSQGDHPFLRLSMPAILEKKAEIIPDDEEDEEEEDSSREGVALKPPLSPILSAPTTIRFPAQTPDKDRSQSGDSGFCRWDKCEASFESSGGLLEHLQVRQFPTASKCSISLKKSYMSLLYIRLKLYFRWLTSTHKREVTISSATGKDVKYKGERHVHDDGWRDTSCHTEEINHSDALSTVVEVDSALRYTES